MHIEEINKAPEWKVTLKNSFSFYFNFTINGKWINEKTKERENSKGLLPQHKAFIDIIFEWAK